MAQTDHAPAQYDRTSALVERGATTTTRLEDAHQLLAVAEAAPDAANAPIARAGSGLDRARTMRVDATDETEVDILRSDAVRLPRGDPWIGRTVGWAAAGEAPRRG